MVICDVGTSQCDNGIVKCEEKKIGYTECDKSTVKSDVDTA